MGFEFKPRPRRYVPICNKNRELPIEEQLWVEYMAWHVGERLVYMQQRDEETKRYAELQKDLRAAVDAGDDDKANDILPEHDAEAIKVLRYRLTKAIRVGIGEDSITDSDEVFAALRQEEELALEIAGHLEGEAEPRGEEVPT